jgi:non-canonical poly(A) RNA polymerase PAPD5/7
MTGFGMDFGGSPQAKMHQGMVSCNVIKEYVQNYPCLKEVVLLLKRFLAVNNLNSAYQGKFHFIINQVLGGISSYSTVLLVVAYMNNFNLHKSPHLTPSRLLMGFLEFYCNHFDPKVYGVNTANGG